MNGVARGNHGNIDLPREIHETAILAGLCAIVAISILPLASQLVFDVDISNGAVSAVWGWAIGEAWGAFYG